MLVPRAECEKVVLWYQANSYLCRMRNVRSGFMLLIHIMFAPRTEC